MKRLGTVLVFKPGTTLADADAALAKIADVLEVHTGHFSSEPTPLGAPLGPMRMGPRCENTGLRVRRRPRWAGVVHPMTKLELTYRCPTSTRYYHLAGCGHVFTATPDWEGLVDCPNCGIWFSPTREPDTVVPTPEPLEPA